MKCRLLDQQPILLRQQVSAENRTTNLTGFKCLIAGTEAVAQAPAAEPSQGSGKPIPNKIPLTDPDLLKQLNNVLLGCCICLLRSESDPAIWSVCMGSAGCKEVPGAVASFCQACYAIHIVIIRSSSLQPALSTGMASFLSKARICAGSSASPHLVLLLPGATFAQVPAAC